MSPVCLLFIAGALLTEMLTCQAGVPQHLHETAKSSLNANCAENDLQGRDLSIQILTRLYICLRRFDYCRLHHGPGTSLHVG